MSFIIHIRAHYQQPEITTVVEKAKKWWFSRRTYRPERVNVRMEKHDEDQRKIVIKLVLQEIKPEKEIKIYYTDQKRVERPNLQLAKQKLNIVD